jgi:enoyl-CoA hydratase
MTLELPETFTYEKKGHIALMTINRPEAMNAFTGEMLKGMDAAFDDFNEDPELGGLEFLQGTDMRIASDKAIFGLGEVKWGVVPAGGTHIRLPQQIPWAVAMEMVLAGENITAERAYQIGLVNKIVPVDQVLPEAMALAERICQNGPLAVRTAKEIMVRSLNNEPGFVLEKTMAERVFRSEDAKEGPRAFAEKRKPVYTGK